jgi:hypothetical protein
MIIKTYPWSAQSKLQGSVTNSSSGSINAPTRLEWIGTRTYGNGSNELLLPRVLPPRSLTYWLPSMTPEAHGISEEEVERFFNEQVSESRRQRRRADEGGPIHVDQGASLTASFCFRRPFRAVLHLRF